MYATASLHLQRKIEPRIYIIHLWLTQGNFGLFCAHHIHLLGLVRFVSISVEGSLFAHVQNQPRSQAVSWYKNENKFRRNV